MVNDSVPEKKKKGGGGSKRYSVVYKAKISVLLDQKLSSLKTKRCLLVFPLN